MTRFIISTTAAAVTIGLLAGLTTAADTEEAQKPARSAPEQQQPSPAASEPDELVPVDANSRIASAVADRDAALAEWRKLQKQHETKGNDSDLLPALVQARNKYFDSRSQIEALLKAAGIVESERDKLIQDVPGDLIKPTGKLLFGVGVNSDVGVVRNVVVEERDRYIKSLVGMPQRSEQHKLIKAHESLETASCLACHKFPAEQHKLTETHEQPHISITERKTKLTLVGDSPKVLWFKNPVTSVTGFDANIIRAAPLNADPRKITVQVDGFGFTSLSVVDSKSDLYTIDIFVTGDTRQLQHYIGQLYPEASVQVIELRESVLLRGTVSQPQQVEQLTEVAEEFYPKVINQVRVANAGNKRSAAESLPENAPVADSFGSQLHDFKFYSGVLREAPPDRMQALSKRHQHLKQARESLKAAGLEHLDKQLAKEMHVLLEQMKALERAEQQRTRATQAAARATQAVPLTPLHRELRGLRQDVRQLRNDVNRLRELLEKRTTTSPKPEDNQAEALPAAEIKTGLLVFHAPWSAASRKMIDMIDDYREAGQTIRLIDVDQQPDLVKRFEITMVPTLIYLDYRMQFRYTGVQSPAKLKSLLKDVPIGEPIRTSEESADGAVSPATEAPKTEGERIEQSLGRKVSIKVQRMPLSELVKKISRNKSINIVIDGRERNGTKIDLNTPVSVEVKNVELRSALKTILDPLGLTFTVEDEVLKITPKKDADE